MPVNSPLAWTLWPAMGAALVILGCGPTDNDPERYVVRDSADVRIVETTSPTWEGGAAWEVVDSPALQIGLEDGDPAYLFSRVAGAVRTSDGRVVVGDGTSNQLRFFDQAGRFIRSVGRTGQGPGEFEYLRSVERCGGDSIFAFDINWQLKVFTVEGDLVREASLTEPGVERSPYRLACSPEGRFVITGWGERVSPPQIGFYAATSDVWLLDPEGHLLAELGTFVSSERIGSRFGSGPHPFGRSAVVAADSGRVYVGPSETFEILAYGPEGGLESILRGPPVDLEITPAHLERYRNERLEGVEPQGRPAVEREIREMSMPPAFPAYDRLQVDPEGNLWVGRYLRPGDERRTWAVFDRQGVLLGDVITPSGLEVMEIGTDYLLGVHQDRFGVERVRLHELRKAPPESS